MSEPLDDRSGDPRPPDDRPAGGPDPAVDPTGRDASWPAGADERARALRHTIGRKAIRHGRARQRRDESIWAWLGTFGLVGWTVVVPTLGGLALGLFLDDRVDGPVSFTITLLVAGAALGSVLAWYWVRQESPGGDDR
jgi:ATP synthase protein I